MKKNANEQGNLYLVEYMGSMDESNLNWGFIDRYFEEEKIPVLFIFSNFPHTVKTNRQSLAGSIRTHVEERKGIIFFPISMKDTLMQVIQEALKKERSEMDFLPYSGSKSTSDYFSRIVEICFSIKRENLKVSEIKIMAKEEIMELTEIVTKTIPGSLSYLLIKDGKLVNTKNISLPSDALARFVTTYRLSSVLLTNFSDIHRDLMDKKVGHITLHDKADGKIILIKQFKDIKSKWDLVFICTEGELEAAKDTIKNFEKRY